MKKMLVSVALAAAALAAAPATAQEEAPVAQTLVTYGDLNIGNAAGRATLDRRIRAAARMVCGVEQAPGLAELNSLKTCRDGAIGAAKAEVEQVLASRGAGSSIMVAARR
jgi:UrcA family protein